MMFTRMKPKKAPREKVSTSATATSAMPIISTDLSAMRSVRSQVKRSSA
jgi:hypothetical protein